MPENNHAEVKVRASGGQVAALAAVATVLGGGGGIVADSFKSEAEHTRLEKELLEKVDTKLLAYPRVTELTPELAVIRSQLLEIRQLTSVIPRLEERVDALRAERGR